MSQGKLIYLTTRRKWSGRKFSIKSFVLPCVLLKLQETQIISCSVFSTNINLACSFGLQAIEEICRQGYACDGLDQPSNYAMVVGRRVCRIEIIPSTICDSLTGETNDMVLINLRNGFATMLDTHIRPLWNNLEFDELITLIINPDARYTLHYRYIVSDFIRHSSNCHIYCAQMQLYLVLQTNR